MRAQSDAESDATAGPYPPVLPTARPRIPWFFIFLALLWLGATFVYFGDTGKHSDDYWAASRFIDREGIDWSVHPWQSWPYFWRPLHLAHAWIMNTIFWRHDWVPHLELALAHAAVCVMLYRLLIGLGSARGPAIAAVLLYGTCPLLGEAIGWSSASCNAISSLLMLITLDLGRRFGSALPIQRADGTSPPAPPTNTLRSLVAIALLSFATACFYEPAAAGLAAIPIIVWAACPRASRTSVRLRRTFLATLAAGLPCVLYLALLLGTAPPGQRGSAETVGSAQSLPDNAGKLVQAMRHMILGRGGRDIVLGSIEQGLTATREHPIVLAIIIATILAGLLALLNDNRRWFPAVSDPQADAPKTRGQLLLLGIVLLVVPWLPFFAQHEQGLALRSFYVPLIGFAFLIAALGNGLHRWMSRLPGRVRSGTRVIATIAVGVLTIAGQVGLVGMQTQFRTNARQDALVTAQLAAMSSHVEPKTVFMILAADHRGADTSRPTYNAVLHSALEARWSATTFLWRAMRRHDITVISAVFWSRGTLLIDHLTPEHLQRTDRGERDRPTPWSKIVPLWIDSHATVHVVESLTIEPLGGAPVEVHPPRAQRLAQAQAESAPNPTPGPRERVRLIETKHFRTRVLLTPAQAEPDTTP
jgi:hypothetical protein